MALSLDLAGRVALVTGGSQGIGAGIAQVLVAAGAHVVTCARSAVEHPAPAIEDRAVEVQTLLADRGQHRAPSVADLVVAATAELAGLVVLHVDEDPDLISGITGQATERLTTA